MQFLLIPAVGFIILMVTTFFLVGEMLVKARGILGILGLVFITTYFMSLNTGDNIILIIGLFIVGLFLVFLDGKFINDGTVAVIGFIIMITAVVIPAPSIIYGILSAAGLVVGGVFSPLLLKALPSRDMWSKVALKDRLTSDQGYNSINPTYLSLVGKKGKTITPFRPVGTIEIEGVHYSAVTDGEWVEKGIEIIVVKVDGTKIVIQRPKD